MTILETLESLRRMIRAVGGVHVVAEEDCIKIRSYPNREVAICVYEDGSSEYINDENGINDIITIHGMSKFIKIAIYCGAYCDYKQEKS